MAFKILNNNIIDDTRNIVNASSVGVGTTTSSAAAALFVIGNTFATGISTSSRFASNVVQGTAPISVASSTRVDTLNVEYLDGNNSSYYRNASNLNAGQVPGAQVTQSSGLTVTGNLSVSGNVTIGGTATQLNAQQLRISDRDITLGVTTDAFGNDVSTDTTANHGGIAIASTEGSPILNIPLQAGINTDPSTYKQLMWIKQGNYSGMGTDAWVFNYAVSIGNTASVQNLSRLTVGAGFTVFDTYLDATDIRARNITAVTNINASGIITSGNHNVTTGNSYQINGTSVLNATTLGSAVVNSSLTSVGTLGLLNVTGIVTAAGGFNASSSSDYEINGTSVLNATTLGSGVLTSSLTSVGTLATLNATNITNTNINSTGIHSAATYNVGVTTVISTVNSQIRLAGIATIDATTKATLERELAFAPNQFDDLSVTGIATFSNGPVLIGTATSTGTAGQALQVGSSGATRGAYISGSLGIGTTSPTQPLDVNGNARLRAGVYDFNNQVGAAGSVLISTGAGVSWTSITGAGGASININSDTSTTTPLYLAFTSATTGTVNALSVDTSGLTFIPSGAGSLGIGTTSPTDNLDVNGTARLRSTLKDYNNQVGAAGSVLISTGAGVSWTSITGAGGASISISNAPGGSTPSYLLFTSATSGSVNTQNVSSNKLTYIDSTGSLGIGTTSPTQELDVNGDFRLRAGLYDFNNVVGAAGSVLISTGAGVSWTTISGAGGIAGITITDDNVSPQIRYPLFTSATSGSVTGQFVDTNGIVYNTSTNCLGIGSLTPTSRLDIIGDVRVSGIVTAGDFNSTSDRKLKTNIQPIINPIEKVLQISGVSFNWKETGKATLGVIAQEIELVLPELVSDTDPKTVNYNGLIGLLIECVKDQQNQIDELKQITAKKTTRKPKNT